MNIDQIAHLLAISDEDFDKAFKEAHPEAAHLDLDEDALDVFSIVQDKLSKDAK